MIARLQEKSNHRSLGFRTRYQVTLKSLGGS
jgi:hypothetical protein